MNPVIKQLKKHRSIRKYKSGAKIPNEQIDAIIRAAQCAPSWMNGQQYSMIGISDQSHKEKLAELTKNPYVAECSLFLVFVADFHRIQLASEKHYKEFAAKTEEDLLIVAATDVGLACQNALIAAESLGFGTVCIGGIRRNMAEVCLDLNLPKYTFPIVGLCIGYPDVDPPIKPRLPKEAVYFAETYKPDTLTLLEKYDEEIIPFSAREGSIGYTERMASAYEHAYFPSITKTLKKQGFLDGEK